MPDYDLDRAYRLETAEDTQKLYADWAATYDDSFGAGWGYIAPREIAGLFRAAMGVENQPILDLGAGTGLVAEHLAGLTVDAIDITQEMLDTAAPKGLYRALHRADVTRPLAFADASFGGVISCGTFTHGHVGPVCLPELLRIARPGALFVCGTIAPVFDAMGFGSALAKLQAARAITPVIFHDIAIYEGTDHPHAGDRGLVMEFRKL